jgi:enoyl-CoA hydratase/carnithine racemase
MSSEPTTDQWSVDRDDHVCLIRFMGGERRTMTIRGAAQLGALLRERAERSEPPVIVLEIDVLHAELDEVLEMARGRPIADWKPWVEVIAALGTYPVATIASIPRQATCGGLELSLGTDVRIAAPGSRLGVLETRIGLIPGAGGTQRLPGLIGMGNASLLVLSGEAVSGTEAHRMGLVQLLDENPSRAAQELAERIAAVGHQVIAAAKRALHAASTTTDAGLRVEGRAFLAVVGLPSTIETMTRWTAAQAAGEHPALEQSPLP